MMSYKKILGIFKAIPMENLNLDFLTSVSNMTDKEVLSIIEELKKDGHIEGKRKYKLTGEYKEAYLKMSKNLP